MCVYGRWRPRIRPRCAFALHQTDLHGRISRSLLPRASLPAPSMAGLSGGLSGKRPTQRDHPRHPARDSTRPNPFSCKRRTRRGTPGRVTRSSRRPPYVKIFASCSMHLVHRLVGDPRGRQAGSRHPHLGWKQRKRCSATHMTFAALARLLGTSQRQLFAYQPKKRCECLVATPHLSNGGNAAAGRGPSSMSSSLAEVPFSAFALPSLPYPVCVLDAPGPRLVPST